MNIDFELFHTFYITASFKSFLEASKTLHISQPALSKSMKKLEEQIGATLFLRTKKGISLSADGKLLYEKIASSMKTLEEASSLFITKKSIRIGTSTTLVNHYLSPFIIAYRKKYPDVQFHIISRPSSQYFDMLEKDEIDFMVLTAPYDKHPYQEQTVKDIHDVFVTSTAMQIDLQKVYCLEELTQYPLVLYSEETTSRKYLDAYLSQKGIFVKATLDSSSLESLIGLTQSGVGISCMIQEFITKEIADESLHLLQTTENIPSRSIRVVTKDFTQLQEHNREFIDSLHA